MDQLERAFVLRMRELLVSLPYDIKVFFEAVTDENLAEEARAVAAGATIYCLSPSDPIPDSAGIMGFADDVVLARLCLQRLLQLGGDECAIYPERFPETFARLQEDLTLFRNYLGETMSWLEAWIVSTLTRTRYKGKNAPQYVRDAEALEHLYNEGREFTTNYEIDDDAASRLRDGESVRAIFARRMEEEARRHRP